MTDRKCPDCGSNNVQSKGKRAEGVHRYLCVACGRNYTMNENKVKEETMKDILEKPNEKKMTSISVSIETKAWLENLKLVSQEPLNAVLDRIRTSPKLKF